MQTRPIASNFNILKDEKILYNQSIELKRISWRLSLYHQFKTEIDYKLYSINIPFITTSSAWVIARIILYLDEEPISDASRW